MRAVIKGAGVRSRLNRFLSFFIRIFAHIIPKNKDIVVFGAFFGNRYGDNSSALFEYCNSRKAGVFKYYWLTDGINIVDAVRSTGANSYLKISIQGVWLSLRASLFVTSHSIKDVLFYHPMIGRTPESVSYTHLTLPTNREV